MENKWLMDEKNDLFSNPTSHIKYSDVSLSHFLTVAQRKLSLCFQNSIRLMLLGSHYFRYFLNAG